MERDRGIRTDRQWAVQRRIDAAIDAQIRRHEDDSVAWIKATHGDVAEFIEKHMRVDWPRRRFTSGVLVISERRAVEEGWLNRWHDGVMSRLNGLAIELRKQQLEMERTKNRFFELLVTR